MTTLKAALVHCAWTGDKDSMVAAKYIAQAEECVYRFRDPLGNRTDDGCQGDRE